MYTVAFAVCTFPQITFAVLLAEPPVTVNDWPLPATAITTNPRDAGWPPFAEAMATLV